MSNDAEGAVVLNLGDLTGNSSNRGNNTNSNEPKKKQDTLFGPNIGIVTGGPDWTENPEKPKDELTADVVKGWIAKSKEVRPGSSLCALYSLSVRPSGACHAGGACTWGRSAWDANEGRLGTVYFSRWGFPHRLTPRSAQDPGWVPTSMQG